MPQIIAKLLTDLQESAKDVAEDAPGSTPRSIADAVSNASLAAPWSRAFVQLGGLDHIASILLTINLNALLPPEVAVETKESGQLMARCLQLLLQLFSCFAVVPVDINGGSSDGWRAFPSRMGSALRPAFVRRMLDVMACIAATALPSDDDLTSDSSAPPPPKSLTLSRSVSNASAASASSPAGKRVVTPGRALNASAASSSKGEAIGSANAADDDGLGLRGMFGGIDDDLDFASPSPAADDDEDEDEKETKEPALVAILRCAAGEILSAALFGPVVPFEFAGTDAKFAAAPAVEAAAEAEAVAAFRDYPDLGNVLALILLAPSEPRVRTTAIFAITGLSWHEAQMHPAPAPLPLTGFILSVLLANLRIAYTVPRFVTPFFYTVARILEVCVRERARVCVFARRFCFLQSSRTCRYTFVTGCGQWSWPVPIQPPHCACSLDCCAIIQSLKPVRMSAT
jgi:hypothetical protein